MAETQRRGGTPERHGGMRGAQLRVRVRPSLLARLKLIAEHDSRFLNEPTSVSDVLRDAIIPYVDRREAEIRATAVHVFTGKPPLTTS